MEGPQVLTFSTRLSYDWTKEGGATESTECRVQQCRWQMARAQPPSLSQVGPRPRASCVVSTDSRKQSRVFGPLPAPTSPPSFLMGPPLLHDERVAVVPPAILCLATQARSGSMREPILQGEGHWLQLVIKGKSACAFEKNSMTPMAYGEHAHWLLTLFALFLADPSAGPRLKKKPGSQAPGSSVPRPPAGTGR